MAEAGEGLEVDRVAVPVQLLGLGPGPEVAAGPVRVECLHRLLG